MQSIYHSLYINLDYLCSFHMQNTLNPFQDSKFSSKYGNQVQDFMIYIRFTCFSLDVALLDMETYTKTVSNLPHSHDSIQNVETGT